MSNPKWSKTALAQAVGLTVVGVAASTDLQAQENKGPTLALTNYDLHLNTDNLQNGKYGGAGTGQLKSSDAYRLSLTVPLQPTWDVRISANKVKADGNPFSVSSFSYGGSGYATSSLKQYLNLDSNIVDFEAGHHINLGHQDVRVFAGLRYVDLKSEVTESTGFQYKYTGTPPSSFSFDEQVKFSSKLKAYGLRAGAETTIPLNQSFSVSGLAAASLVNGTRENKLDVSTSKYAGYSANLNSDHGNWRGEELEMALNWNLSPEKKDGSSVLSLGYTWNREYNILNTNFGSSTIEKDLTEKGLFLRLQVGL